MAEQVYYEVTGYSDQGLIVKFTLGHQTMFATLVWDGVQPIDEFLKKQASFQGMRLKMMAQPKADFSMFIGRKGSADIFDPQMPVPPHPLPVT